VIDKKKPDERKRRFLVAVFWDRQGYGGRREFKTWEEAMDEVRHMQKSGYGVKQSDGRRCTITVRERVEKLYWVPVLEPKES